MRMMVTARIPVQRGSAAIKEGTLPQVIKRTLEALQPECAYFFIEGCRRTMRAVFDLKQQSDMVPLLEPLLMELDAEIEVIPALLAPELAAGFAAMK